MKLTLNKEAAASISAVSGLSGYMFMFLGHYRIAAALFTVVSLGGLAISWYKLTEKGQKPASFYALTPEGLRRIKENKHNEPTIEEITFGAASHAAFLPLAILCWHRGDIKNGRRATGK